MAVAEAELKALMLASLDGDALAYRTLLDRLTRHLRAYYKRRLATGRRHTEDAEDLVQETLLAIHSHRHTYDRTKPLTPWVFAIARYRLIDHLRHTRGSAGDVPLDEVDQLLAERDESRGESAYDLGRLLRRLPDGTRRAIECMKLEGMSAAEAAKQCGISESAVKVKVHRGLKALATLIMREKAKA